MLKPILALLAMMALAACSTVPDQMVRYYRVHASTQLALTQTVTCTPDGKHLLIGYSVVNTTINKADPTKEWTVHVKDLDSNLANIALVFKFTEDHRLAGVNTTQQGQGDTVLADIATVAAAARGLVMAMSEADACVLVTAAANKTIALTYKATPIYTPAAQTIAADAVTLTPDDATEVQLKLTNAAGAHFEGALPGLKATWTPLVAASHRIVTGIDKSNAVILKLNDTVPVHLAIIATPLTAGAAGHEVWSQDIVVPFVATPDDYDLAIPKAPLFGKQTFAVTLSDTGSILELDLGKDSGVGAATTAAGSAYNTVRAKTPAERLAELKANDDLKAEQVRAAKCNADPTTC